MPSQRLGTESPPSTYTQTNEEEDSLSEDYDNKDQNSDKDLEEDFEFNIPSSIIFERPVRRSPPPLADNEEVFVMRHGSGSDNDDIPPYQEEIEMGPPMAPPHEESQAERAISAPRNPFRHEPPQASTPIGPRARLQLIEAMDSPLDQMGIVDQSISTHLQGMQDFITPITEYINNIAIKEATLPGHRHKLEEYKVLVKEARGTIESWDRGLGSMKEGADVIKDKTRSITLVAENEALRLLLAKKTSWIQSAQKERLLLRQEILNLRVSQQPAYPEEDDFDEAEVESEAIMEQQRDLARIEAKTDHPSTSRHQYYTTGCCGCLTSIAQCIFR